jgi:hypothetical protein
MIEVATINKNALIQLHSWILSQPVEYAKLYEGATGRDLTLEETLILAEINQKRKSFDRYAQKLAIARQYVSNLTAPHENECKGVLSGVTWQSLPIKVRADIYNKIVEISNVSEADEINLS